MANEQYTSSRRGILGALMLSPAIAVPALAAVTGSDAGILAAWEVRQRALALAMENGPYVHIETHSPDLADIYDQADNRIITSEAYTARGALCQAWVHWSCIGTEFTPETRRIGALIRAADFPALEREKDLDWEHVTIRQVVRTLRNLVGEAA